MTTTLPAGHSANVYQVWIDMRRRCNKPSHPAFKWYGAKGIHVCDRWNTSFANFLEDMGEKPLGLSLDRIDVKGPYEPSNCRWATQAEQQRNRSNNKLNEAAVSEIRKLREAGERTAALAIRFGVSVRMIRAIVNHEKWA